MGQLPCPVSQAVGLWKEESSDLGGHNVTGEECRQSLYLDIVLSINQRADGNQWWGGFTLTDGMWKPEEGKKPLGSGGM